METDLPPTSKAAESGARLTQRGKATARAAAERAGLDPSGALVGSQEVH